MTRFQWASLFVGLMLLLLPSQAQAQTSSNTSTARTVTLWAGGTYGSPTGPSARILKTFDRNYVFDAVIVGALGPGGAEVSVGFGAFTQDPQASPKLSGAHLLSATFAQTFSKLTHGTPRSSYVGVQNGFQFGLLYGSVGYARRIGGTETTGRNRFSGSVGLMIPIVVARQP